MTVVTQGLVSNPVDVRQYGWLVRWLCYLFKWKEIGWQEIREVFFRWTLLKTPWFGVYLHRLDAPEWHPESHSHPWRFLALILYGGYWERTCRAGGQEVTEWRWPGTLLWRRASYAHTVRTRGVNWSLVIVGRKSRAWGFFACEGR